MSESTDQKQNPSGQDLDLGPREPTGLGADRKTSAAFHASPNKPKTFPCSPEIEALFITAQSSLETADNKIKSGQRRSARSWCFDSPLIVFIKSNWVRKCWGGVRGNLGLDCSSGAVFFKNSKALFRSETNSRGAVQVSKKKRLGMCML